MGYIYIGRIEHVKHKIDLPNDLKIGKTSNTVDVREKGIIRTKSPYTYKMLHAWDCGDDYSKIERTLHILLGDERYEGSEFFDDYDSSIIDRVSSFMALWGFEEVEINGETEEPKQIHSSGSWDRRYRQCQENWAGNAVEQYGLQDYGKSRSHGYYVKAFNQISNVKPVWWRRVKNDDYVIKFDLYGSRRDDDGFISELRKRFEDHPIKFEQTTVNGIFSEVKDEKLCAETFKMMVEVLNEMSTKRAVSNQKSSRNLELCIGETFYTDVFAGCTHEFVIQSDLSVLVVKTGEVYDTPNMAVTKTRDLEIDNQGKTDLTKNQNHNIWESLKHDETRLTLDAYIASKESK